MSTEKVNMLIEKDMAETAARLVYFNRVLDMIRGSLRVELEPLPNRIEDADGEEE